MLYDVKSPARYEQYCGAMQCLIDLVQSDLNTDSMLIVTTHRHYLQYGAIWQAFPEDDSTINPPLVEVIIVESSVSDKELLDTINQKVTIKSYQTIIGVGGGSILDAVKIVSQHFKYCVLVPTLLSNDSACTTMAVKKGSPINSMVYRMSNPVNLVVVDPCVLVNTPYDMLLAGLADAVSSYFEGSLSLKESQFKDKGTSITMTHGDFLPDAFSVLDNYINHFTCVPLNDLKGLVGDPINIPEWFEHLLYYCFYLSGYLSENTSINIAHALATAIDTVYPGNKILHGYKVAVGLTVQSLLTVSGSKYTDYSFNYYIPSTFKAVGLNPTDSEIDLLATITANNKYVHQGKDDILEAIKEVVNGES